MSVESRVAHKSPTRVAATGTVTFTDMLTCLHTHTHGVYTQLLASVIEAYFRTGAIVDDSCCLSQQHFQFALERSIHDHLPAWLTTAVQSASTA